MSCSLSLSRSLHTALLAIGVLAGCSHLPFGKSAGVQAQSSASASSSSSSVVVASAVSAGSTPDLGAIEANLARLLGADTLYSASAVQGTPSPLCPVVSERAAVSLLELDASKRTLECYLFPTDGRDKDAATYTSLRDYQDHGNIHHAVVWALPGKKSDKPHVSINAVGSGGGKVFNVIEVGDQISILFVKLDEQAAELDRDFVLQYADKFIDLSKASFDVLVTDPAKAKPIRLADEKQRLITRAQAALEQQREAKAKADAAALAKVRFPAAIKDQDGARAVAAARAYIESSNKSGIDPTSIKKIAMTSRWTVTKSRIGLILHRTADVSVGFARTDAYAADPNKQCAFVTLEVKAEYDGASAYEEPIATGMATKWTNIACDRLK